MQYRRPLFSFLIAALMTAVVLGSAVNVEAVPIIDLTTAGSQDSDTSANGVNFVVQQTSTQPTGSGVIDSFVRINPGGNADTEQGYNTSARPVEFDENTSPTFTRDLLLTEVPIVNFGGTDYRQFLLDINQTGSDPTLSLNQIQIFLGNTANLTGATIPNPATATTAPVISFGGQTTEIFRLSSGDTQFEILLNAALGSGSGSGDMFLLVANSAFSGGGTLVTLYSQFGTPPGTRNANDGFEEWAVIRGGGDDGGDDGGSGGSGTPIPEPGTVLLLGSGLVAFGLLSRKKMK